ncbi:hypothetical protein BDE02_13G075500, partial [Populus trichocarpa]
MSHSSIIRVSQTTLNAGSGSPGFSHGLNWALARKGVTLQQKGAIAAGGVPVHVRGSLLGRASEISKPHITTHISSISNIYIHDGAIGALSNCNAKVRVISDSPSAILHLSNILWKTPARAVSHDCCVVDAVGLGAQGNSGLIAADIERSSLILCGEASADTSGIKEALAAFLLVSGNSVIVIFAPEDTIQTCAGKLVSADAGVILSSQGVVPYFQTRNSGEPGSFKFPSAIVFATSDSISTAYRDSPSINTLEFAKALSSEICKSIHLFMLKDNQIPSLLVNVKEGEKSLTGHQFLTLVQSSLSNK